MSLATDLFESVNKCEQVYILPRYYWMKREYWDNYFTAIDEIPEENIRKEIFKSERGL